jgi:hypothetical protein
MTTTTATPHHVHPHSSELRRFVLAVRMWALAGGRALEPSAIEAVVGAAARPLTTPSVWTTDDVEQLVWVDVLLWCDAAGRARPVGLGEALWWVLGHLADRGLIADGSDPLAALQMSVCEHTALGPDGRPLVLRRRTRRAPRADRPAVSSRHPSTMPHPAGQPVIACAKVHDHDEPLAEVLPWRP